MMRGWRFVFLGFAGAPFALSVLVQDKPAQATSGDVIGIFRAHCITCHGAKGATASLDLSSLAGLMKGGASGKAVVPGQPDKSLILDRILGKRGLPKMPMGFGPLAETDVAKIRSWISAGAKDGGTARTLHWAYKAPVRPKLPAVKNAAWVKNAVDTFVLSRLEQEKLKPSKSAAKETLLRRVYLDLIGLPPSPKEIDSFLADPSPNAYEKVVDRLLANPHFGERMARPWLDLARYADSDGFEKDLNRTAWLYRDWVINAFNANMPYDEFAVEQLAGDLLPNATLQQKVATGFNRNTMFNREGGVDQNEAHYEVILDRVGTTATVWLGSTLQCARCHDHKYDPFTQKDFYKMYAYFGNTTVYPQGPKEVGEEKWFEEEIKVPSAEQSKQIKAWNSELAQITTELDAKSKNLEADYQAWLKSATGNVWQSLVPKSVETSSGEKAQIEADGTISLFTKTPNISYMLTYQIDPANWRGLRLQTVPDSRLSNGGAGNADGGNFVLSSVNLVLAGKPLPIDTASTDFTQEGFSANGLLDNDVNTGWAVYPMSGKAHELALGWSSSFDVKSQNELKLQLNCISTKWPQHTLAKFRLAISKSEHPEQFVMPTEVRTLLAKENRTSVEDATVRKHFESVSPVLREVRGRQQDVQTKLASLNGQIPSALILKDKPAKGPLMAAVHHRGEFLSPGEMVPAGTPSILPALPKDAPSNRLGLARWVGSKSNPLTARVEVNRLWEMTMGRGLVETSEDFGTQGSKPTHPELLDWLSTEFMDSGWNVKRILKLIVTSNTYQQDSTLTPTLAARDPQNLWLARGSRFRMEAEMIRDVVFAASGQLSPKVGGPSVYPLQPEGVWNTPYNGENWMTSKGEDRFRRGLYTFVKRTSPFPTFMAFDATSRESCTVRRTRTNTPLQALAMLNDKALMEAAGSLSKRMAKEGGTTDRSRLVYGFRLISSRKPSEAELRVLEGLLAKMRSRYRIDPVSAAKVASNPEEAAWTMVGNVLLNLDEAMTKE